MKGLINFPKAADVDFAASLTVVLAVASAMLYVLATGFSTIA
jgi:hypothetical protein